MKALWPTARWDQIGNGAAIALAFCIPTSTALTNALMAVIVGAWLVGPQFAKKRQILLHHPLVQWCYPLIAFTLVGILYSVGDNQAIRNGVSDGLRLALIPIFMYFYQNRKTAQYALWAFMGAMVFTLILAFLKIYGGVPIGVKYTTGGIFKSHIVTSFFMAIATFFLTIQIKKTPRYSFVLIPIILAMLYYLFFMNVGRIGYITIFACFLFLAWHWYRMKGLWIAAMIALSVFAGAYIASPIFAQRINLLSQDMEFYHKGRLVESSLGSRLAFALSSLEMIKERPLLGWGTGSFGAVYTHKYAQENTLLTDNPHNEYLRVGVEFGFLGALCLILLFYHQWRLARQLPVEYKGFYQGILLTFIIGCLFNSWLKDFTEAYFYCFMTALCFAALPLPDKKKLIKANMH